MITQPNDGRLVTLASILDLDDQGESAHVRIRSCGTDSDKPYTEGLFICLADHAAKAEKEINRAMAHGAVAVVVRRGLFMARRRAMFAHFMFEADEPRSVYGRACQLLLDNPGTRLKLIAVTGTAGKTSLSYVLAGMLAEAGCPVGLIGSLGTYNGVELIPGAETTPNADQLALRLAEMAENGCTHAIVEVSDTALDEYRIAGLTFDAICLTNIRRDHIDRHRSVEQYRKIKMRIFDYATPRTLVVCNGDDRVTEAILHLVECPTITVGMHPTESLVSGMLVEQNRGGQTFYIVAGNDAVAVHTKIIGHEHIYNCLIAAGLGICWGISLHTIVPGLERVEHIPGRNEQIDCGQPFVVVVDNASTRESLEATLHAARNMGSGRLYCVLGVTSDADRSTLPLLGRTSTALADVVVLTSASFTEPIPEDMLADLLLGMEDDSTTRTFLRRHEAISRILSDAAPDDIVVITGNDPVIDDDSVDETVSSRQFVRNWLYENQPSLEPFWF